MVLMTPHKRLLADSETILHEVHDDIRLI